MAKKDKPMAWESGETYAEYQERVEQARENDQNRKLGVSPKEITTSAEEFEMGLDAMSESKFNSKSDTQPPETETTDAETFDRQVNCTRRPASDPEGDQASW